LDDRQDEGLRRVERGDNFVLGHNHIASVRVPALDLDEAETTNAGIAAFNVIAGGAEWNGPAYDPQLNLVFIGEVEWCTTVTVMSAEKIAAVQPGKPWSGEASINPFNTWGEADPTFDWAGWTYAVEADTGVWRWRAKTNYPIQSGMTPTAGGIVFFGDMGGNFYAANGRKLWGQNIRGAIGGGVVTYLVNGMQKIAVAKGLTEILWPTEITTAKVSILGLE
jgi:alcohol dehydrogenase (cytochrome c)